MRLPEDLKDRPFKEWNELVKVAVWAWELARIFHCEKELETFLASDQRGNAIEFMAHLVNGRQLELESVKAVQEQSSIKKLG